MAQQIIKYCPQCKDFQFFEWQVDASDPDLDPEFWLMCCCCGFETEESKLNLPEETD
jgi:hypothetical protein